MALATRPLSRRIQASEALARQRGVDLQNLSELNEYIVQHLRESIVVIDADRTIRLINSSATQLLGASGALQERPLADIASVIDDYIVRWREDDAVSSHAEFQMAAGDGALITAHLAPLGLALTEAPGLRPDAIAVEIPSSLETVWRRAVRRLGPSQLPTAEMPVLFSTLAPVLRPLARSALRAGVLAYEKGRETFEEMGETVEDVVAEVREELLEAHESEEMAGEFDDEVAASPDDK